jgi:lysozyme
MTQVPNKTSVVGTLSGGATIALMVALSLATPEIMRWEGKRNDPYRDIVGVLTVCYGETQGPMRRYSDAECSTMLNKRVEADYAKPILKCVPGFADRPYPFAASISLSYNIGVKAFCGSTAARRFNARNWAGGCDALLPWNKAGGKVVNGLVRRREAERKLCLKGVA